MWIHDPITTPNIQHIAYTALAHPKPGLHLTVLHWITNAPPDTPDPPPIFLALALYGEARGHNIQAMTLVYTCALNRCATASNHNLDTVLLAPRQFSCFNPEDNSLHEAHLTPTIVIHSHVRLAVEFLDETRSQDFSPPYPTANMYCTLDAALLQFRRYLMNLPHAWNWPQIQLLASVPPFFAFRDMGRPINWRPSDT